MQKYIIYKRLSRRQQRYDGYRQRYENEVKAGRKFASYELVPTDIQGKLIAEHEAELAKEGEYIVGCRNDGYYTPNNL